MSNAPQKPRRAAATVLIGLTLVAFLCGLSPQPAYASDFDSPLQVAKDVITSGATFLGANNSTALVLKGYVLDPLAWVLAKTTLNSMTKSVLTWATNGFNGSPAFVTDLNAESQKVSDTAANNFLQQLATNSSLDSNFQNQVYQTVSTGYFQSTASNSFFTQNAYTLKQTTPNDTACLGGQTTQCGMNGWLAMVTNPANNPLGATLLAQGALTSQTGNAVQTRQQEIQLGQGISSYRGNCSSSKTASSPSLTSLASLDPCLGQPILTPGSLLNSAFKQSGGASITSLENAQSLGQTVASIAVGLIQSFMSPTGLSSVSSVSTGSTGTTQSSTATAGSTSTTGSATAGIGGSLSSIVVGQESQLQTYQTNWQTVLSAAQSAQTALQASTCPSAQQTLTGVVNPILQQAQQNLNAVQSEITELNTINGETSTNVVQASDDYSCFMTGASQDGTPCAVTENTIGYQQISDSTTQAGDSGQTTPPSDYTEMTQAQQQATQCTTTTSS